jgi:hypothetical protein
MSELALIQKCCAGCGHLLPVGQFSRNAGARDGLQERCKACFSVYNRARYGRMGDTIRAKVRRYQQENPRAILATRLRMCASHPSQRNAYRVVEEAIRAGVLVRPDVCHGCGCGNDEHRIEAHHHDYSKPLTVLWLCTPCHRRLDMRKAARIKEARSS